MNAISKPHLVDLLRIFDKKRYISPRIRYASVRSKPELIADLARHFRCSRRANQVTMRPVSPELPLIRYDLKTKNYMFDGQPLDVPRQSREKARFEIREGPVTLTFPFPVVDPRSPRAEPRSDPPATRTATASSPAPPAP